MAKRLVDGAAGVPAFVLERDGTVLGYSYGTPWPGPKIHPATLETTIYLAPEVCGRGLGRRLYAALLSALEERRVHTAIGCIALPNEPSRRLHAALDFTLLTVLEGAAEKHGRRHDLECWAKRLR
jgi:phosphinothricin acetyltransferase